MTFKNKPLNWKNSGIKPEQNLIDLGWRAGDKPPAEYFNYKWNNDYNVITELQEEIEKNVNEINKAKINIESKASKNHQHSISDILNLDNDINEKLENKADKEHTHNYAGAQSAGGSANSAIKLQNAKNFSITGGATSTSVAFNGSSNVTLNVTSLNTDYLNNGSNTLVLNCGTSV